MIDKLLKDLNELIKKTFSIEVELKDYQMVSFTEHGDVSTNISFELAKKLKKNPYEIAESLSKNLFKEYGYNSHVTRPGFINIFFPDKLFVGECKKIVETFYGKRDFNQKKVNIEFISANPTGPLVLVNLRAGIAGMMLANVMEYSGFYVEKENYINDAGNQVYNLGASVLYHISLEKPEKFPENGYKGLYVKEIAKMFEKTFGKMNYTQENIKKTSEFAKEYILNWQKKSLKNFSIEFDNWIFESDIKEKYLDETLKILTDKNLTYLKDNALYLKTTLMGDDKDRVIIKSNGEYTYFLPDVAYHYFKLKRGFNKIIDILGPDHHGYIPRLTASIKMLKEDEVDFDVIIAQLVTMLKNGQKYEMSKRTGEFITLDELSEEIDPDVLKFTILSRKLSQPFNFDIEKVKEESMENPVYYVQYSYARLSSLFDKFKLNKNELNFSFEKFENKDLRNIAKKLFEFPYIVYNVASSYEIQKIPNYLVELSSLIHQFYYNYRIIDDNREETIKRITILYAAREIIKNGLSLMGITLKERMFKNEV